MHGIDRVRNYLALFLVGAFVGALVVFTFVGIPDTNKDIVTYMVGQLSGMTTMALGIYFTNKIGQESLDEKRTETTGKLADALASASNPATAPENPE